MTPLINDRASKLNTRSQRMFLATVAVFILVVSFGYGFVKGSRNLAQASFLSGAPAIPLETSELPDMLKGMLPSDARVASMGTDMRINGLDAEMISFTINRDIQSFIFEHKTLWKYKGFKAKQQVSDRRAVSFAMNSDTGVRASLVVWSVPQPVRATISNGYSLQGTLSVIESGTERKRIPGLSSMAGSIAGSVVASTDLGKRTFTGSFSNPGVISESIRFYDNTLLASGWQAMDLSSNVVENQRIYRRGLEELTLIFTKVPDLIGEVGVVTDRTLLTAVLSVSLDEPQFGNMRQRRISNNSIFGG